MMIDDADILIVTPLILAAIEIFSLHWLAITLRRHYDERWYDDDDDDDDKRTFSALRRCRHIDAITPTTSIRHARDDDDDDYCAAPSLRWWLRRCRAIIQPRCFMSAMLIRWPLRPWGFYYYYYYRLLMPVFIDDDDYHFSLSMPFLSMFSDFCFPRFFNLWQWFHCFHAIIIFSLFSIIRRRYDDTSADTFHFHYPEFSSHHS